MSRSDRVLVVKQHKSKNHHNQEIRNADSTHEEGSCTTSPTPPPREREAARRDKARTKRPRSSSSSSRKLRAEKSFRRRSPIKHDSSRSEKPRSTAKVVRLRSMSHEKHSRRSASRGRSRSRDRNSHRRESHKDRYREQSPYSSSRSRDYRRSSVRAGRWNSDARMNPPPSSCLGIFGMSAGTHEDHLRDIFSKYGLIRDMQIIRHPISGTSRGFGFINYYDQKDATSARNGMTGKFLLGNELRVDYSISKGPRMSSRPGAR